MTVQYDKTLDIALGNYTVYKHTSPAGKVYIGITRDKLQHRWKGGTGETYASVHDAAVACGGSHSNIVKACTGERQTAYGYRWAYKEVRDLCS